MGVITGLSAIKTAMKERPGGLDSLKYSEKELTRNIAKNGERTIRFLQELDESSPLFNKDLGLGAVAVEYEHPEYYWLKLTDTHDKDGGCWPSEQGWTQRITLYVNVIDVESGEVFYLARSILGGLGAQIIESATDRGSITDGIWKIKKTGEGIKTRYSLNLISLENEPISLKKEDLIDFSSIINEVPYDRQEEFVRGIEQRMRAKAQASDSPAPSEEDVW